MSNASIKHLVRRRWNFFILHRPRQAMKETPNALAFCAFENKLYLEKNSTWRVRSFASNSKSFNEAILKMQELQRSFRS